MQTRRLSSQSVLGALVIVIGLALLAETTGYADVSVFWTYVPSLFVLLGLFALVASGFRNVVGPVIVVVPREWNVTLDVLPIVGGASDDRLRTEHEHGDVDLIVTGFAVFGGVTVKD